MLALLLLLVPTVALVVSGKPGQDGPRASEKATRSPDRSHAASGTARPRVALVPRSDGPTSGDQVTHGRTPRTELDARKLGQCPRRRLRHLQMLSWWPAVAARRCSPRWRTRLPAAAPERSPPATRRGFAGGPAAARQGAPDLDAEGGDAPADACVGGRTKRAGSSLSCGSAGGRVGLGDAHARHGHGVGAQHAVGQQAEARQVREPGPLGDPGQDW